MSKLKRLLAELKEMHTKLSADEVLLTRRECRIELERLMDTYGD